MRASVSEGVKLWELVCFWKDPKPLFLLCLLDSHWLEELDLTESSAEIPPFLQT